MTYDVIIPCFNAAPFIAETIDSVQGQSIEPERIIAVDDGSTDDTLARLHDLLPASDVFSQMNNGPGHASMTGVGQSTAKVLAFIDADDLWLPQKMAHQLSAVVNAPVPTAHFTGLEAFCANTDNMLHVDEGHAGWSRSTMVIKRATFDLVGPFRDTPNRIGEMVDWLGRAKDAGVSLERSDSVLARRRLHANSLTRRTADVTDGYLAAAREAVKRRRLAEKAKRSE